MPTKPAAPGRSEPPQPDPKVVQGLENLRGGLEKKLPGALDKLAEALGAPRWNKLELMQFLLGCGADPKATTPEGMNAVFNLVAAWSDDQPSHGPVLRELVKAGADPAAVGVKNTTPLHLASVRNHRAALVGLLALGVDPNTPDQGGLTVLHRAALQGQTATARLLSRT